MLVSLYYSLVLISYICINFWFSFMNLPFFSFVFVNKWRPPPLFYFQVHGVSQWAGRWPLPILQEEVRQLCFASDSWQAMLLFPEFPPFCNGGQHALLERHSAAAERVPLGTPRINMRVRCSSRTLRQYGQAGEVGVRQQERVHAYGGRHRWFHIIYIYIYIYI